MDVILQNTPDDVGEESSPAGAADAAEGSTDDAAGAGTEDADEIYVYICGAVSQPGVYKVRDQSRIYELVELAGGLTEDADAEGVNLALSVQDGMMIRIPTAQERAAGTEADESVPGLADIAGSDAAGQKVNINTAGVTELTALNGIGETKAAAIVAYREEHGSFRSIEEIMEVSGIGEGTFDKIKEDITV